MNKRRWYGRAAILVAVFALLITAVGGVVAQDEPAPSPSAIPLVLPPDGAQPVTAAVPTEIREVVEMSLNDPEPLAAFKPMPGAITADTVKMTPPDGAGDMIITTPPDEKTDALAPASPDGWSTLMHETFEGAWPVWPWKAVDKNGTTGGKVFWDDDDYRPYMGGWSAWAANGGPQGLDPASYYYPHNMRSWAIYGPFDLSDSTAAYLGFYYWNQSEANYDWLNWMASHDGVNFGGYRVSGDSQGWRYAEIDLSNVPTKGSMLGDSSVWIAINFTSDTTVNDDGPFVDEVWLEKYSACPTITAWKGEYWNNTTLAGTPTLCRNDNSVDFNWGTGGPGGGVQNDLFSARWTRQVTLPAGRYRFVLGGDDGVRLFVDNVQVINKWIDQSYTEYSVNRTLGAGKHTFRIQFYERYGDAVVKFYYEKLPGANMALNKVSTAWNYQGVYTPRKGNDGNYNTRWAGNSGTNWWWVDLGSRKTFNQVRINWELAYAQNYFVGYSDAPNCLGIYSGFNYTNGALGWRTHNIGTHTARCVAIRMDVPVPGLTNYSFWEFEVYNAPGASAPADFADSALIQLELGQPPE